MSIESKIKNEVEKYEIKTTSFDILNKVPITLVKKSFSFKKMLLPLSITFACSVILIATLFMPSNDVDNPNEPIIEPSNVYVKNEAQSLTDSTTLSKVSFDLYYGGILSEDTTINTSFTMSNPFKSDEDEGSFSGAVDRYKNVSDMIENLYNLDKEGLVSIFESVEFEYEGKQYIYKLTVDNYIMYLNKDITKQDEVEENVLFYMKNNYYYGSLEIEKEKDEFEVEISYTKNNRIYEISRDYEKDEYSIEYKVKNAISKAVYYEQELEIEYDDEGLKFDFEFKDLNDHYHFKIKEKDGNKNISYEDYKKNFKAEMEQQINEGKEAFKDLLNNIFYWPDLGEFGEWEDIKDLFPPFGNNDKEHGHGKNNEM